MAGWRRKALELFPDRPHLVAPGGSKYTFFADLLGEVEHAYQRVPPDRGLVDRAFQFATWCFDPKQNRDLRNAAAVSFYEHLPTIQQAQQDFADRMTPAMWEELQPLLAQMLEPAIYESFAAMVAMRHREGPRRQAGAPD